MIIVSLVLGIALVCWLLKEKAHLLWEYHKLTSSPERVAVMREKPTQEYWGDVSTTGETISLGYASFRNPYEGLSKITWRSGRVIFESESDGIKMVFAHPWHYGYELYKTKTMTDEPLGWLETMRIRYDSTLVTIREWRTRQEWQEIEANKTLHEFWKEYADEPCKWNEKVLYLTPKSIFSAAFMDVTRLNLYLQMLEVKYNSMKGNADFFILFDTVNSLKGLACPIKGEKSESILARLWDTERKIKQTNLFVYEGVRPSLLRVKELISSFSYIVDKIPEKRSELQMITLEALTIHPFFHVESDTLDYCIRDDAGTDIIEKIIPFVEELDAKSIDLGLTPLHVAVLKNRIEVIILLLAAGANINALSERDETPLHLAAASGNTEIVKLLLEKGVITDTKDIYGFTAYASAKPEVIDIFKEYGVTSLHKEELSKFSIAERAAEKFARKALFSYSIQKTRFFSEGMDTIIRTNKEELYYAVIYRSTFLRPMSDEFYCSPADDVYWIKVSGLTGETQIYDIYLDEVRK